VLYDCKACEINRRWWWWRRNVEEVDTQFGRVTAGKNFWFGASFRLFDCWTHSDTRHYHNPHSKRTKSAFDDSRANRETKPPLNKFPRCSSVHPSLSTTVRNAPKYILYMAQTFLRSSVGKEAADGRPHMYLINAQNRQHGSITNGTYRAICATCTGFVPNDKVCPLPVTLFLI
jgi:hypothetical protein